MNWPHHRPPEGPEEAADMHQDYMVLRRLVGDLRRQIGRLERERDEALLEASRLKEQMARRRWYRQ